MMLAMVNITLQKKLTTKALSSKGDTLITHGPAKYGGEDEKFSPPDLLLASLGSCILTVMGIYAAQLGVDLEGASVACSGQMQTNPRRFSQIDVEVRLPSNHPDSVKKTLERAALNCPVHQSLHPDISQNMRFIWGHNL